jgi:hypothetical protein
LAAAKVGGIAAWIAVATGIAMAATGIAVTIGTAAGITAAAAARSGFRRAHLQSTDVQESRWIPVAFLFLLAADMGRE